MFKKSPVQKRIDELSKLLTNGYKFVVTDAGGKITAKYRYQYETMSINVPKQSTLRPLKELLDAEFAKSRN